MMDFREAPASWNTRYETEDGFTCQLTLRANSGQELLEKAEAALAWLRKHGYQPAGLARAREAEARAANGNGQPPTCPTHGTQMQPSRFGGWFCPERIADDDGTGKPVYCRQKVK